MAIDYEKEYDNRGRVPEHPEIFARWEREAAAYRAASPGAELGLTYGPSPRQTIDLFPGQGRRRRRRSRCSSTAAGGARSSPRCSASWRKGPNAKGVTVAVAGYDLCPQVTIAAIIEQMRAACLFLWRRYGKRIMVSGHSAGGHLAACMVATDWKTLDPDAPADLVPAGYAISGVFDLAPLMQISVNQDLRLDDASARRVLAALLERAARPHARRRGGRRSN